MDSYIHDLVVQNVETLKKDQTQEVMIDMEYKIEIVDESDNKTAVEALENECLKHQAHVNEEHHDITENENKAVPAEEDNIPQQGHDFREKLGDEESQEQVLTGNGYLPSAVAHDEGGLEQQSNQVPDNNNETDQDEKSSVPLENLTTEATHEEGGTEKNDQEMTDTCNDTELDEKHVISLENHTTEAVHGEVRKEKNGQEIAETNMETELDEKHVIPLENHTEEEKIDPVKEETSEVNEKQKLQLEYPEPSLLWKIFKTFFLIVVWVCLGLCGEITGPTLLDLKLKTHSNYESVSTGVAGRSIGFFIGSAMGGVLVDKFGLFCNLMVAISMDAEAIATVAVPWMPDTNLLFVMTLLQGTCEGVINIAGQKLILNMWQEQSAAPLHLLHGGFGIGSFIIPLIANPFLAITTDKQTTNISTENNVSLNEDVFLTTALPVTTEATEIVIKESRMEYAYLIAAVITVTVSVVFYFYHFTGGKERKIQREKASDDIKDESRVLSFKEMINPATCAGGRFFYGLQIFVLVFLFFIQAVGGERVAGKFIRTYSIKYLHFSDDDGTYINTVFWIAFAVGRVTGFLTARFIPIRVLILLETGGCLLTSILLVIFGGESTKALWILMPIMGYFIAPLFPSGVGWANYHIDMTGISITAFMMGGSIGGIVYMKLTGYMFDHYGYRTFLYMLLGYGIAAFVISVLMTIVGAQHGSRFEESKKQPEKQVESADKSNHLDFENKGFISENTADKENH